MIRLLWEEYKPACLELLKSLIDSSLEATNELGSFTATNLYILYPEDENILKDILFKKALTSHQIKGICSCAQDLLKIKNTHDRANQIISELTCQPKLEAEHLNGLFYDDCFVLPGDIELIQKIVATDPSEFYYSVGHYIEKNMDHLLELKEIIFFFCNHFAEDKPEHRHRRDYWSEKRLSSLVSSLYDAAANQPQLVQRCLDTWDTLYEVNIGGAREQMQKLLDT